VHTRPRFVVVVAFVLLSLAAACRNEGNGPRAPLAPSPLPEPTPPPVTIEYRVTGTIPGTRITYFSSLQGTTQVATDLPWAISYQAGPLPAFVYLAAEAPFDNVTNGTLVVQIFVGGVLFREARGSGFVISIAASGEVTP
jgi:hypothetical protein